MMQAFHGKQETKDFYIARVERHRAADELVRGIGWENGRGCAIGCVLEAYDHSRYPIELGLPEWLAHLEDRIFEGLPNSRAMTWPGELLAAIPVGAVVGDDVKDELAALRLERLLPALIANREPYARKCEDAVRGVIAFLSGTDKSDTERSAASSAAYSAAGSAADSAADSARSAAYSAADSARSAAYSARSAAYSAADSARSAADSAADSARSAAGLARSAARSAADSAYSARSAARSAYSAAYSAADSAYSARSAARSAYSAAYSAADSAYSAARSAAWAWEADTLLALLRGVKP